MLAAGVSTASLPAIVARLVAGDYDLGYVRYVLDHVKGQVKAGKVKKEGGAVFKALTEGYLLAAYQAQQASPRPKARVSPALVSQRKKLQSELEDARNSLQFFQTSPLYTEETRQPLVREVKAKIAQLEAQLVELGA